MVTALSMAERTSRKGTPTIARRLVILVALAVIPVLAFSAFMMVRYAETERAGYETQIVATTRALSLAIDREIEAQEATLIALSGSPELMNKDWAGFYERARSVAAMTPGRAIILAEPSGQEIINTILPLGSPRMASGLENMRKVVATGAPVVSDLIRVPDTNGYGIGVEIPVFRNGVVAYVLMMGFSPDRISDILIEQGLKPGWVASVIDHNRIILARSRNGASFVGQPAPPAADMRISDLNHEVVEAVTKEGVRAKAARTQSALTGWTISMGVEEAVFNAPLRHSLWLIGGGGGALVAAALIFAFLYSRRIAEPVTMLSTMAASLAAGEPPRIQPLAIREAEDVAEQIRRASDLLQDRTRDREALLEELEDRVAARTQELTESEAKYRLVAENITDMIVRADTANGVTYVSPSAKALTGYELDELLGTGTPLVHPDDFDDLMAALRTMESSDHPAMTRNYRICRKTGEVVWVEGAFRRLFNSETGHPSGYVATVRDMTKHRIAEERAAWAAARAEAANQAKSDFLASMSHELRTPLNAVIGFAQLLLHSKAHPLAPKQREAVEYILRGGHQLLELIQDVLDLAKIEAGRLRVSIEPVETLELMDDFADTLAPMAREKGLKLVVEPPPNDAPKILADNHRLLQVLTNFGSNALKYNRPGGCVRVSLEPAEEGWVRIAVTDTGMGIAAEKQGEVFQPFNRLGAERSAIEGTGIGLSICRSLIVLMRGRIGFQSEEGKGSCFWVELPKAGHEASVATTEPVEAGVSRHGDLACTVLYIEDRPESLELMHRLISSLPKAEILTASTGEVGVALAMSRRPDIVITDIHLPDMTGFDVLSQLRVAPETAGIPVVALSADAMPDDIARGSAAGFAHYLTKPFLVPEILATIQDTVGLKAAAE